MTTQARMKFAIDDGSTNVKISWIENGTLKTVVSPNSFRKDWKSAALLRGQRYSTTPLAPPNTPTMRPPIKHYRPRISSISMTI